MKLPIQAKPIARDSLESIHLMGDTGINPNQPYKGTCFQGGPKTVAGCRHGFQLNNISHNTCCANGGSGWEPGPGSPIPNICTPCP